MIFVGGRQDWVEKNNESGVITDWKEGREWGEMFLTTSPQGSFFPFYPPSWIPCFPSVLCFSTFSYANNLKQTRGAEPRREVKTGGSIKEIWKTTKPKVEAGEDGHILPHFVNMRAGRPPLQSNHSPITQLHTSLLLPWHFHPSSVTSGWGEKPSPERNKAGNGEITASLSEWLSSLQLRAHLLSREEPNLLHDPSSPRGPQPFGFDGFRLRQKEDGILGKHKNNTPSLVA